MQSFVCVWCCMCQSINNYLVECVAVAVVGVGVVGAV